MDFDIGEPKGNQKKPSIAALNLVIIAVVCAALALACYFADVGLGGAIFGAMGLMSGGYSMGFINRHAGSMKNKLMYVAMVCLLVSVISFMLGFVSLANSL